jgi:hypothetical protein
MASTPAKKKATSQAKPRVATKKKVAAPKKRVAPPKKKVPAPKKRATPPKKKGTAKKTAAKVAKPEKSGKFLTTEEDLANFLDCSRSAISRLKRKDGCPVKTADGKYSKAEWKEFYEKTKGNYSKDDEDLAGERKAKRERAEIALQRERLELEKELGQYLHIEEVCKIITQAWSGAVQHLKEAEHIVAPLVAGLNVPDARALIRKTNIDVLERFSLGEWAKKKPFWGTVYALLRDLRETSSLGSGLSETSSSPGTPPS